VRWDDDAITHNCLRMYDNAMIPGNGIGFDDVIGIDATISRLR
jgi:hypothetical protein